MGCLLAAVSQLCLTFSNGPITTTGLVKCRSGDRADVSDLSKPGRNLNRLLISVKYSRILSSDCLCHLGLVYGVKIQPAYDAAGEHLAGQF